jgi:hypothetical protein
MSSYRFSASSSTTAAPTAGPTRAPAGGAGDTGSEEEEGGVSERTPAPVVPTNRVYCADVGTPISRNESDVHNVGAGWRAG